MKIESTYIYNTREDTQTPCSFRTINTNIDKFLIQTLIAHQFLNPIRCNLLQLYPFPLLSTRGLDGTGREAGNGFRRFV